MPKARSSSYNLAFKLIIGISESMVRRWRKDQANLFNGELKMSAKRKTMGCYSPKYPELDQTLLDWFSEQRSQGKFFVLSHRVAMFTQAVGMTASDWPVSHVVKPSQTIDLNLASLLSFTGVAVSGFILRLKAKELCRLQSLIGLVPEMEKAPFHQPSH